MTAALRRPPSWPLPSHPPCRWCQVPIRRVFIADRFDWVHVGAGYPCPDRHYRAVSRMAEPDPTGPYAQQVRPAVDAEPRYERVRHPVPRKGLAVRVACPRCGGTGWK